MDQYIEFISNHYLLALAWVAVTFLLIQDLIENSFSKFSSISPMLVVTKMNSDDTQIVDIRDYLEFKKGHIEDAINIPLTSIEDKVATLAPYKNQSVIVVCQNGARSAAGCKALIKAGFEKVFNITGGMQSWEDSKLPITKENTK